MATTEPEAYASVVTRTQTHHSINRTQSYRSEGLIRALTHNSIISERRKSKPYDESDEDEDAEKAEPIASDWSLAPELRVIQQQGEKNGVKGRQLGVTWKSLTVKGVGADAAINESVGSQLNVPRAIMEGRHGAPLKTLVDNSHGCVKPGEMLLVLGRPGAGCTTLLKILSNRRHGYAEVTGDVRWGTLDPKEVARYRGQIVMNTEDELFFPALTVGQTIDFATRMKGKYSISPFLSTLVKERKLAASSILADSS
jgi:ABC-type glutathione transport system ATPase component